MNKNFPTIDFAPESAPMRRTKLLIYVSACIILLAFSGQNALYGDEGDLAEAIRQMFLGNDIFSSECWWQPDTRSFLWFCRLRMLPALFFGGGELICRLFTIISAICLLSGTMFLAGKFFNRRAGACAAWMMIASYGFIYWGRYAGSFMSLALWVLLTVICLRNVYDRFWWRSIFFLLIFSGTVWWGMNYLLFLPGIVIISFNGNLRILLWKSSLIAIGFAALVVFAVSCLLVGSSGVPWLDYPARFWYQFKISFAESCIAPVWSEYGLNNIYKPSFNLLRVLFPWSLPVAAAVAGMIRKWSDLSGSHRRLLAGTLVMLLCAALFPGRRWQYLLGALPFFIMICAGVTVECVGMDSWSRIADRIMWWSFCFLGSLAVAVIVTWPLWQMIFRSSPPLQLMLGVPFLGVAALLFLVFDTGGGCAVERVSGMNGPWSGYILAGVCLMTAVFVVALSAVDPFRSGRPFWKHCGDLAHHLPPHEIIYCGSFPDSKHLYYMALPAGCTVVQSPGEFAGILKNIHSGEALLIVSRADFDAVSAALKNAGWSPADEKPLAVESGAVDFYGDASSDGSKFIVCRIKFEG